MQKVVFAVELHDCKKYNDGMLRRQAFKFELLPRGRQQRDMHRFAGACRYVFNQALALQKANREGGGKFIGYVAMAKRLTEWRNGAETPWLKAMPRQEYGSTEGASGLRPGWAMTASIAFWLVAALWPGAAGANTPKAPSDAIVKGLMTRDLVGVAGKEVLMITVEYLAGGASLPHRHNAQVFVYVLEGKVRMQVEGSAAVTLGPGGTFYEGPDDVHTISANASQTKSARILVFMVKDKGAPVSSDAGPAARP